MNRILSILGVFLGVFLALALAACDGATAPDLSGEAASGSAVEAPLDPSRLGSSDALKGFRVTVGLGQTVALSEIASELTLDAIRSDNRCPAYLDCVERGEARAAFTFYSEEDGAEYAIELGISGGSPLELSPKEVKPVFAGGHAFRLVRLQPYPGYAPDYAPDTGPPVKATVVVESCAASCD